MNDLQHAGKGATARPADHGAVAAHKSMKLPAAIVCLLAGTLAWTEGSDSAANAAQQCLVCHTGPLELDTNAADFQRQVAGVVKGDMPHPSVAVDATDDAIAALIAALRKVDD